MAKWHHHCVLCIIAFLAAAPAAADQGSDPAPLADEQHTKTYFLPAGDIFKPLIIDIKMPRFFVGFRQYGYQDTSLTIAAVGVGEVFGLYRSADIDAGSAWQISIGGGLQAQFNLDASSKDLINADYFVSVPFSYRHDALSYRILLYHQSSHLGDEYLLNSSPTRMEFSYEALNAVQSYEWSEWRGYYGGEVILRKEPHTLKTLSVQGGMEYHGSLPAWGRGFPVAGLDMKALKNMIGRSIRRSLLDLSSEARPTMTAISALSLSITGGITRTASSTRMARGYNSTVSDSIWAIKPLFVSFLMRL